MTDLLNHVREPWMAQAACRGMSPSLFFPARGDYAARREALATCAGCTVKDECLEYGLRFAGDGGIWGGTTERQRMRIRVERSRAS